MKYIILFKDNLKKVNKTGVNNLLIKKKSNKK